MTPVVWREPVRDEWIDYNGHLSEPYYVLVFGHATDAVMDARRARARSTATRAAPRCSPSRRTCATSTRCRRAPTLEVRSAVIGATGKLLWIWHELRVDGPLRATEEILGVHVDTASERSVPFPDDVARSVESMRVPPPDAAGRRIALAP